ncbi:MAG: hypothetical protein JWP06_327 [Candidatus Saccharibacteria bacterium]|jgi:hypothetical protein|nr:hypothetical protein [Candidatus Saccharibacteria bacterium]
MAARRIPFMTIDGDSMTVKKDEVSITFNTFYVRLSRNPLRGVRSVELENLGAVNVKVLGNAQQYRLTVAGGEKRCMAVLDLINAIVERNRQEQRRLIRVCNNQP